MSGTSPTPPSFQPKKRRPRPSSADAHRVGRGKAPRIISAPVVSSDVPELSTPKPPTSPAGGHHVGPRRPTVSSRKNATPADNSEYNVNSAANNPQPPAQEPLPGANLNPGEQPPSFAPIQHTSPSQDFSSSQQPSQSAGKVRRSPQGAPVAPHRPPSQPPAGLPYEEDAPKRRFKLRPRRILKWTLRIFIILLIFLIAWPLYLLWYGNSRLHDVDALTGASDTPGNTYLIVGSDAREADGINDPTKGERADTIMLLHVPRSGNTSLISLPRDSYVEIPGEGRGKLNSAFSYGGPKLLTQTVEKLTGLTVDHYIQITMGGVQHLVDAVGGVNLCYDSDVDDEDSQMKWTAGCHDVNGQQALAFSRMRKADPLGDIGRTNRQRQVVSKVISKAASTSTLINPFRQRQLVGSVADILKVSKETSIMNIAKAGWSLRGVMGEDGVAGVPPIADLGYRVRGQSVVLLNSKELPEFFAKMRDGKLTREDVLPHFG
ncbi:LCP family protein [Actinotignum urinale]|uniref:LCP family protein n=1 Tax=Actinotignum urinale TaxID=190146 RepID=A0AAW9HX47_9ACTO|nr:LCP family protein [Actinotignum urinale]MDY5132287.1 LCP family protein [Actinotignum urinale]MDY5151394.1 LCP family protein [Actinotignum urinale]MDY5154917.1 LCP family protein [Actinotignum urinale]MDY5160828.1 LCP family protein [Actinotignum urinale]WIK59173.1 LCP family protein [Actinotignum urinale]